MLKAMVNDHLNTNKENLKMFLKMLADELLAFCEATQVFSKSRSIRSPNVLGLYELLVEKLDTLIFELDHHLQDFIGPKKSKGSKMHIHGHEGEIAKIKYASEEKACVS